MKILMFHDEGLSCGQLRDEDHIAKGFRDLGIEVFQNDESKLGEVDLVLCFKAKRFGLEDVKRWKTITQAPIWIWTFDNMNRFSWFYPIAKECDLWLGEELGRRERFKQEGLPFYYFPYHAVPPDIFYPIQQAKEYDVVFTGTPYGGDYNPNKHELLKAIDEEFDLHVFGNNPDGWRAHGLKNVHEPMFDTKLSEVYSKAKVVIALSNVQCEGYWSIRTSQALMCGACTLARFTPQMEKELRDNVVYFEDIDDCLKKLRYLLREDKVRERLAMKGYLYAHACLTTIQRLKELILLYEFRRSLQ